MKNSLYLVVGLGKTGLSIARHLQRNNKRFIIFDTRTTTPHLSVFQQEFPTQAVYMHVIPQHIFSEVTEVIVSPGVPLDNAYIQQAMQLGLPVYGDIECLAREIQVPVIAITGTNGKSTVTSLVGDMAQAAGLNVAVAGNIGEPVLDKLANDILYDLWVLELSSFQLDLIHSLKPLAATVLNISPDHLDRHHTMDAYIHAKKKIYDKCSIAVFNRDDLLTKPSQSLHSISFGYDNASIENWGLISQNGTTYLAKGQLILMPVDSLLIKGSHNWINALAACALADAAKIEWKFIKEVLSKFSGLSHRCQWIRTLDGVEWINDSKGTNIGATVSAINGIGGSMQGKIILIAGGQGKGADFSELAQPIADHVRSIVLIGEDADKIENALAHVVPTSRATTLDDAVTLAKSKAKPGDVVLLSPACASLDMFRDFNHRGELFTSLVGGL